MGDNSERLPTPGESDNFDPSWAAVLALLHHMDGSEGGQRGERVRYASGEAVASENRPTYAACGMRRLSLTTLVVVLLVVWLLVLLSVVWQVRAAPPLGCRDGAAG